ncbi:MAG: GNAT family N-acetyltransferase [Chloroflexota bacterium]
MNYTVTEESFASLADYWPPTDNHLRWLPIFVLPAWLRVWWQTFGAGARLYLGAVRQEAEIIGIIPLSVKAETAAIIGSPDVCDYLDFVTVPGREDDFSNALLDELPRQGIKQLDLKALRPDSFVLTHLVPLARRRHYEVRQQPADVALEVALPPTWEAYLEQLTVKQRHELRRKLRRLEEAGGVDYRTVTGSTAVTAVMDTFLELLASSRPEKADFMTPLMSAFFRAMAASLAAAGLLTMGVLEIAGQTAAMVMAFDYQDSVYLYNSGYAPGYRALSPGLLSKALLIKDSIQRGRKLFDFMKGNETYKYHLGGHEVPLYDCQISLR